MSSADTITSNVKGSQDLFAFFIGQAEGGRWHSSVYTKPHEPNWAKRNSGLSTCQHSNPITLVSTVIFNISLSLKYSRGGPTCLFSSDGPYASEQRWDLEYFRTCGSVANYSGFVHSCVNLFFLWEQVHVEPYFPGLKFLKQELSSRLWLPETKQHPNLPHANEINLEMRESCLTFAFGITLSSATKLGSMM